MKSKSTYDKLNINNWMRKHSFCSKSWNFIFFLFLAEFHFSTLINYSANMCWTSYEPTVSKALETEAKLGGAFLQCQGGLNSPPPWAYPTPLTSPLHTSLVCSIIFSPCILKRKIIISSVPMCWFECYYVNDFSPYKVTYVDEQYHNGN